MLMSLTLNTDKYRELVGELPDSYVRGCIVEVDSEDDKKTAINQYWLKSGGTGGYKRHEKISEELFNFNVV